VDDILLAADADGTAETTARFVLEAASATVDIDRVVFATGFEDVPPDVPDLSRFTVRGLHYCLHCDAYSLGNRPVFVAGHDDHAAHVALVMLNVTDDVDLLLHARAPEWSEETDRQLRAHPIDRINTPVTVAFADENRTEEPWLWCLRFEGGTDREYRGGFAVYGRE